MKAAGTADGAVNAGTAAAGTGGFTAGCVISGGPVPKRGTVVAAANISGDGTELDLDDGAAAAAAAAAGGGVGANGSTTAAAGATGGGGGMVPTAGDDMTGGTIGTTLVVGTPPMTAGLAAAPA